MPARPRSLPQVRSGRWDGYLLALRNIGEVGAFAIAPVLVTAITVYALVGHGFAFDYNNQFWPAGRRLLDGLSPWDLGWQDISNQIAFPYGAVPALLFAPLAILPHGVADATFTALLLATVPLTLRLLGVRDWRVYGVAFLWVPVLEAWGYANVSLLLALGIALMWRYRDRPVVVGVLLAVLVSVKFVVWPLGLWLLATRRYAALAYAAVAGLAVNLVAWAVVGFDQIGPYLKVLGLVTHEEERRSYALLRLALDAGAGRTAAYLLMFGLAAAVGAGCIVLARRGDEVAALLLCVAMGSLATPVTWPHYWALLLVPVALMRPRLGLAWILPVAMAPLVLAAPGAGTQAPAVAAANIVFVAIVAATLLSPRARRAPVAQAALPAGA